MDARAAAVIRIDAVWLAAEPLDMRAGTETALARVVNVFGEARPHHAYPLRPFSNSSWITWSGEPQAAWSLHCRL